MSNKIDRDIFIYIFQKESSKDRSISEQILIVSSVRIKRRFLELLNTIVIQIKEEERDAQVTIKVSSNHRA